MPITILADSTSDQNVLQEYADNRGVSLRVDRERGIILGVKLLGTISRRGRVYPKEVMEKALPLYEGMRVNIDHVEPGQRRSLRDRVGLVKNVTLKADGLYGDFHFNPKHALAEQIAWDAENAPQNLGFSHDTRGVSRNSGGTLVVESIDKVLSVDLVANPATTTGLFESSDLPAGYPVLRGGQDTLTQEEEGMDLSTLTLQELRESRDDLVKTILSEADEGKRVATLQSQLAMLQETVDGYKAAEAQRALQTAILDELKAAGLDPSNKTHCSEVFLEDLVATTDTARRSAKIDDRKQLVASALRTAPIPTTGTAPFQEDATATIPPATAPLTQRLARFMR